MNNVFNQNEETNLNDLPLRRASDHTPLTGSTPVDQIEEAMLAWSVSRAHGFYLFGRVSGMLSAHFEQGHINATQYLEFNERLSHEHSTRHN